MILSWIRSLFRSDPVQPPPPVGVYRKPASPAKAVVRPVTETLFERPPQAPVVPPTTESDHYRWIDYRDPVQPAPQPETPSPVATNWPPEDHVVESSTGRSASFSGMISFCTGVWNHFGLDGDASRSKARPRRNDPPISG